MPDHKVMMRSLFYALVILSFSSCYAQSREITAIYDSLQKNYLFESFAKINKTIPLKTEIEYEELKNWCQKKNLFKGLPPDSIQKVLALCYEHKTELLFSFKEFQKQESFFKEELRKNNLPEFYAYLPLSLSLMNPLYTSWRGTAGIWQLYFVHAQSFKLKITSIQDERRKTTESTKAAIQYLKFLSTLYKQPQEIILAYISSPLQLNKAIRQANGEMNFEKYAPYLPSWLYDIYLHYAAITYLMENEKNKWLAIPLKEVYQECVSHKTDSILYFQNITEVLKIPYAQLLALNPEYRSGMVSSGMMIKIPKTYWPEFIQYKDSIYKPALISSSAETFPPSESPATSPASEKHAPSTHLIYYKVKAGDNLGRIAALHKVSIKQIMQWNNMRSTRIYPGQKLKIYLAKNTPDFNKSSTYAKEKALEKSYSDEPPSANKKSEASPEKEEWITYTVQPGDNLYIIAQRYPGVSVEDIMEYNNISEKIYPGQVLKIKKKK